ncbi:MAG: hypothetical protein KF832_11830 [Caldilineaceae bacterium]|nr:hypothetical protein [Caldilineaceae bacterium]
MDTQSRFTLDQAMFRHFQGTILLFTTLLMLGVSGCAIFGPATAPTATPTRAYALVPTFTATPAGMAQAPTALPAALPTETPTTAVAPLAPTPAPLTETATLSAPATQSLAPTDTPPPASEPRLTISGAAVNVRSGPATTFDLIGAVAQGASFPLLARNAQGDWWQICCVNSQSGWVYGELATIEKGEAVAIVANPPSPAPAPTTAVATAPTTAVATAPTTAVAEATPAPAAPPPASSDPSAGDFNPDAQYQIVHFKVLGLNENNGGIRDSRAQHHIFLTVLDQNGNGVDGAVIENLVGEKGQIVTGDKGPGKAEITMYYEPFKFRVIADGSGPVTSQTSNQMGLAFPYLPDIVGKLGGLDYEYAVCPTLDVKCQWPIQAVHFSYEITFQKVK